MTATNETLEETIKRFRAEVDAAIIATHLPPLGRCGCCDGPDAQHRTKDAIVSRFKSGETVIALAADYGVIASAIWAVLRTAGAIDG